MSHHDDERMNPERLFLPEDGVGQLYGPDGKPAPSPREREEEEVREEPPNATCDYCGQEKPKRRHIYPGKRWDLPKGWRELPNGLIECKGCRPVKVVGTNRWIRPDPEERG